VTDTGPSGRSTQLEDLTPGVTVHGVTSDGPVTVVAVSWHGTEAVTLTYRDAKGQVAERLLFRADEPQLSLAALSAGPPVGARARPVSGRRGARVGCAGPPTRGGTGRHPRRRSSPLPHQIEAVCGEMIPRQPLRSLWGPSDAVLDALTAHLAAFGTVPNDLVLHRDGR
jgi:hypothetical protein